MSTRRRAVDPVAAVLVAPTLAGILVFVVVPVLALGWIATQEWDLLAPPRTVGSDNVTAVLGDPSTLPSIAATALLGSIVVPVTTACGLGIALLLRRVGRAAATYRTLLLLPWAAAPLATGVVWRWILDPATGALSALAGRRVEWLHSELGAPLLVALVLVWGAAGYSSLFFSAALSQIPPATLEAARLDGASDLRTLASVVMPQLRPVLLFVLATSTVQVLTAFDVVVALTGGGPNGATDLLALRMYTEGFRVFDLGRAAVLGLLLFAAVAVVTVPQLRVLRGGVGDA